MAETNKMTIRGYYQDGEFIETPNIINCIWQSYRPNELRCRKCNSATKLVPVDRRLEVEGFRCKCDNILPIQMLLDSFQRVEAMVEASFHVSILSWSMPDNNEIRFDIASEEIVGDNRISAKRRVLTQEARDEIQQQLVESLKEKLNIDFEDLRDVFQT